MVVATVCFEKQTKLSGIANLYCRLLSLEAEPHFVAVVTYSHKTST
jgi:hypothetical protein